jgi:hypothetical protein
VKRIKTKLKIFVKNAIGLMAKDACGTSDPYVTIQCGFLPIKRTKTQKKKLNPIWNETLEFEYFNTADGIYTDNTKPTSSSSSSSSSSASHGQTMCGNKIVIRVWDEDVGIKAQLDKMLTKESDDFLGQIVLDINELNLNGEQPYELKPRNDGYAVTGYIILSLSLGLFEVSQSLAKISETSINYSLDNVSTGGGGGGGGGGSGGSFSSTYLPGMGSISSISGSFRRSEKRDTQRFVFF